MAPEKSWIVLLIVLLSSLAAADLQMEVGEVTLDKHIDMGAPEVIQTENSYSSPVVVAYIMTRNGSNSVDVRVKNVTSDSFEIFMEEPKEDNDRDAEDIGYIVIEEGNYTLSDGTKLEASTHTTSNVHRGGDNFNGDEVFFQNEYSTPPAVPATLNTYNNQDFMSTTISQGNSNCDSSGCRPKAEKFGLQQEAGETGVSASQENIGWLAGDTARTGQYRRHKF